MLQTLVAGEEIRKRLIQIPGVGLITATLPGSELGNGSAFRNGRSFAAYLGLTPRQHSSGGKNALLGISKRGNGYLRTLLVHCARSLLHSLAFGKSPFGESSLDQWIRDLIDRRGKNKTIVAVAAKLTRVAWAMQANGANFEKIFAT